MEYFQPIVQSAFKELSNVCNEFIDEISKPEPSTKINAQLVNSAFTAVLHLGTTKVVELCEKRTGDTNETECNQSTSESENAEVDSIGDVMDWLSELNDEEISSVKNAILDFESRIPEALCAFNKKNPTGEHVKVCITGDQQIYFHYGELFCLPVSSWTLSDETPLLTQYQFLSMCKAKLNDLNLSQIELPAAALSEANLSGTSLERANLLDADLRNATLNGVDLRCADIQGTNFEGATLERVGIRGAKISEKTNFNNAKITLSINPEKWTPESIEANLNHIGTQKENGYLQVIDSINDKCLNPNGEPQKVDLMRQLIASLADHDVSKLVDSFKDILFRNPLYLQDETILKFINDRLMEAKVAFGNTELLGPCYESEYRFLLNKVMKLDDKARASFMLNYNQFFVQLISGCTVRIKDRDPQLIADAENLYNEYLNLNGVNLYRTNVRKEANFYKDAITNIANDDRALLFYKFDPTIDTNVVSLISRKELNAMKSLSSLDYKFAIHHTQKK